MNWSVWGAVRVNGLHELVGPVNGIWSSDGVSQKQGPIGGEVCRMQAPSEDEERLGFGHRVREERVRLGFCQAAFALLGGVGRSSQRNYESGGREPPISYLRLIAKCGADTQYIVTGVRSNTFMVQLLSELSLQGVEVARAFDSLGGDSKILIKQVIDMAARDSRSAAN